MATSLQNFIDQTRRFAKDWPDQDALTASVAAGGTTLSVADTTLYFVNEPIEIDQESIVVRALTSGTVLTCKRGAFGTTAASHASGATVLIKPRFSQIEIIDAINAGIDACCAGSRLYQPVLDTSLSIASNTYEYTIPNLTSPAVPIPFLSKVEIKETGDNAYREVGYWDIKRGTTPKLKFKRVPPTGAVVRISGFGPFPHLTLLSDTTSALWPANADPLVKYWAVADLLMSGEVMRVRTDTGAIDNREQATRVGASSALASSMRSVFYQQLRDVAMPPMPKHVKSII